MGGLDRSAQVPSLPYHVSCVIFPLLPFLSLLPSSPNLYPTTKPNQDPSDKEEPKKQHDQQTWE